MGEVRIASLKRLPGDHRPPVTLHRRVVTGEHLGSQHAFDFVLGADALQTTHDRHLPIVDLFLIAVSKPQNVQRSVSDQLIEGIEFRTPNLCEARLYNLGFRVEVECALRLIFFLRHRVRRGVGQWKTCSTNAV